MTNDDLGFGPFQVLWGEIHSWMKLHSTSDILLRAFFCGDACDH